MLEIEIGDLSEGVVVSDAAYEQLVVKAMDALAAGEPRPACTGE